MSQARGLVDDIAKIEASMRCYDGAGVQGELKFKYWAYFSEKTHTYVRLNAAAILAMGLTECCAEIGRGKVFWMVKGTDTLEGDNSMWTATTVKLPSLIYVDYVWADEEKDEWFKIPHEHRLDLLNARAGALSLDELTMPITLIFDADNNDNVHIYEGLAPITLTINNNGLIHLALTTEMVTQMQSTPGGPLGTGWQASKDSLTQFKITSGPMVVTKLQSIYKEARPETFFFLRTLFQEAIKGHREWVENGGYTIEGDEDLGPDVARRYEEAVREQERIDQGGSRLNGSGDHTSE